MSKINKNGQEVEGFVLLNMHDEPWLVKRANKIFNSPPAGVEFIELFQREDFEDECTLWQWIAEVFEDQLDVYPDNDAFGYEYGSISGTYGDEPYMRVDGDMVVKLATLYHELPEDFLSFSTWIADAGVDLRLKGLDLVCKRAAGENVYFWTLVYDVENNGC